MRNPCLPLATLLLVCGAANAAETVHEAFDYPDPGALTGLGDGTGWMDSWYEDGQAGPASFATAGLSYTDALGNILDVSGGAADASGAATTRSFRTVADGPLNDVWISFLYQVPESNSLFEGVTFYRGTQAVFSVSNPSITTSPMISLGNQLTGGSVNTDRGEFGVTHLIVLHVSQGAGTNGGDRIEIFVDPVLTGTPSTPDGTINGSNFGFDTIRVAAQNGAPFLFDEFRVGTAFSSVTPHEAAGDQDTDGDGLTDAQEAVLGTDPMVSDAALFGAIRSNPDFFGLFDRDGILASASDGVIVPRDGEAPVPYFIEIQRSSDLVTWPEVETIQRNHVLPDGKNFLRIILEK